MPFSVEKAIILRYNKIDNKNCEIFTKGYPFVFVTDNRNKRQLTEKKATPKNAKPIRFGRAEINIFPPTNLLFRNPNECAETLLIDKEDL